MRGLDAWITRERNDPDMDYLNQLADEDRDRITDDAIPDMDAEDEADLLTSDDDSRAA